MATTLSSKTFFVPSSEFIPWDDIKDYLDSVNRGENNCYLTVSFKVTGNSRAKKHTLTSELEALVVDLESHIWEQDEYHFNFLSKRYSWKEKNIHLTAGEALFLYRWLINNEVCSEHGFYIRNLRKKLGKNFLSEYEVKLLKGYI